MFQFINKNNNDNLNSFFWLFLPLYFLLVLFLVKLINIDLFVKYFQSEKGIIENGTFFVLFVAIFFNIKLLIYKNKIIKKFLYFFILFLLGLIYFAGEEINWGQQWFLWDSNDFFNKYNDQYIGDTTETNFHNISSWLDQKPRFILTFFVIFGGLYLSFFNKELKLNNFRTLIYPTFHCFPTSLICLLFYLLDNSYKLLCFGKPGFDLSCKFLPAVLILRTSEIIEFYISFFLFIYLFSIYKRLNLMK